MTTVDQLPRSFARSRQLLEKNEQWIPGGLASINRLAEPCIAFKKAAGAQLWDIDGNQYIDYHAAFSAYILGHGDEDVNSAVVRALESGRSNYGSGPTEDEGELARLFLRAVPGADKVQFFNTGSEATAQAIRIARAWTGRDHVILMQGGYNGNQNVVAANLMSSVEQLGGKQVIGDEYPLVPITAGIPSGERQVLHAVEFNDLEAVRTLVKRYEVAALITEPALQNIGVVPPRPGYLEGLRELATATGFLLIFDEVKTGFRAGLGGYQGLSGVTPDLSTLGKAMANGFPIAALAGRQPFMDLAISTDLAKRVLIAGTYNCHPIPVAAAIAALTKLSDSKADVYGHLEHLAQRLEEGQRKIFHDQRITATISRIASAHCAYFMDRAPSNWWELLTGHDFAFDTRYRRKLIEHGIYHFPVPTKQGSISYAHTSDDIDATLEATRAALAALSKVKHGGKHRSFMIIDVHSHTWSYPEHFSHDFRQQAQRARAGVEVDLSVTYAAYRAQAPANVRTIVFGGKARLSGLWVDDRYVADYVAAHRDTLVGFLSVDPTQPGWQDELRHGHQELGLRGIKLLPMYAGFRPEDELLDPLWSYATAHRLPVLLHTGTTFIAQAPLKFTLPRRLDDVATRFPEVRIVLAHLGHPYEGECIAVARKHPHVYADISALHYRPFQFYHSLMLVQEYGVWDKILFGTDYPFTTVNSTIDALRKLNMMLEGTKLPRLDMCQVEAMIERDSLRLLGISE